MEPHSTSLSSSAALRHRPSRTKGKAAVAVLTIGKACGKTIARGFPPGERSLPHKCNTIMPSLQHKCAVYQGNGRWRNRMYPPAQRPANVNPEPHLSVPDRRCEMRPVPPHDRQSLSFPSMKRQEQAVRRKLWAQINEAQFSSSI